MHLKWLCPLQLAVFEALLHSSNANHLSYWNQIWKDIPNMKASKHLRVDLAANFSRYFTKVQEEKLLFSPIETVYQEGLRNLYVLVDPRQEELYLATKSLEREWSFPLRTFALKYWPAMG